MSFLNMWLLYLLAVLAVVLVFVESSAQYNAIRHIRLVDGRSKYKGRIEVYVNGRWGTICDDHWDLRDANVACRQLGFPGADEIARLAYFGGGSGPILLDNVNCEGTESSLNDCLKNDIGIHNCGHYEDAGVFCTHPDVIAEIRLVNGSSKYEGRVEVNVNGTWGTICDDVWDLLDATVACRQLGYPGANEEALFAHFGEGTGPILLDNVKCDGNESTLNDCLKNDIGHHNCEHYEDAGVFCSIPDIITKTRLVGGDVEHEGRVEVYVNGTWRTICDEHWDLRDANVVCRQLGYSGLDEEARFAHFGEGTGPSLLNNFECVGNESSLNNCSKNDIGLLNCGHGKDAGVVCIDPDTIRDIRLVDGSSEYEGRVEVYMNGKWGTVCDNIWGMRDAHVVCRQLGFDGANKAVGSAHFGKGTGPILLDWVMCDGNEPSLNDCEKDVEDNYCDHKEDAGVFCTTPDTITKIRLVDGNSKYEGRVEVFANRAWKTICGDQWDLRDAGVVCRQLGYYFAIEAGSSLPFGEGTGSFFLYNVQCVGNESSLNDCSKNIIEDHNCNHYADTEVVCNNPDWISQIRLVGGNSDREGRVEVYMNGEWGTVCDDYWDLQDGDVVCRQLGYTGALDAPRNAYFGEGVDSISLDNVKCNGDENSLNNCVKNEFGDHNCGHYEDASVICYNQDEIYNIRLVGGSRDSEGRVEIFVNNREWGTICDNNWDLQDATVACRQLGYFGASSTHQSSQMDEGVNPILLDNVGCVGTEYSLNNCSKNFIREHDCRHSRDASVICTLFGEITNMRLAGGRRESEGRVEVYVNGEWGTVCDDDWDLQDAAVVCRQLGYSGALEAPRYAHFGEGANSILLDNVDCIGTENSLNNCPKNDVGDHNCRHNEDASVICNYSGAISIIRLVGGNRHSEGRVEVFVNGEWGTVCDNDWDLQDAEVVCRQLGYTGAVEAPGSARFGEGVNPILLDNVGCAGIENSLNNCPKNDIRNHNCEHSKDASVICNYSGAMSNIRLVGGNEASEGRVEVFVNGEWGTVCDDGWDLQDADVVCRQLGYYGQVQALQSAYFGEGVNAILLDNVGCIGTENSLDNCPMNDIGDHNCEHGEDASVICNYSGDIFDIRLVGGRRDGVGRVEVLVHGEWGTVCDDDWDLQDAEVVCRQLGYSGATEAPGSAHFGEGASHPILLDNVDCVGTENTLDNCAKNNIGDHNCGHDEDASVICNYLDEISNIRLVGGQSDNEGRVEIYVDGEWGLVCNNNWDLQDAGVVCRELGYSGAVEALHNGDFGGRLIPVLLHNVDCVGTESSLNSCHRGVIGEAICTYYEYSGVICDETGKIASIRLVGGNSGSEGRVEVFVNGEWGTICDDGWDLQDAEVVCRQFGFSGAEEVLQSAHFGEGPNATIPDNFDCAGRENSLNDCPRKDIGVGNCSHGQDASVLCNDTGAISNIRLVDGNRDSEGRVEVFVDGEWGTVCDDAWGLKDAVVVCRQLGYSRAIRARRSAHFGEGVNRILLDNVRCLGTEISLNNCRKSGIGDHNCGHNEDAGVECSYR